MPEIGINIKCPNCEFENDLIYFHKMAINYAMSENKTGDFDHYTIIGADSYICPACGIFFIEVEK